MIESLVKENFLYPNVNEDAESFLHQVLDLGIQFTKGDLLDGKSLNFKSIKNLKNLVSEPLPKQGTEYDDILSHLENVVLKNSIPQSSQQYLAFPDTGNNIAGLAADIITAFSNQNLIAVDRSAPIATFIEIQLIMWLRSLVGYSSKEMADVNCLNEVGGMWTSGGNMSNYTAVLTALNATFPELKAKGLRGLDKTPAIILSKGIQHFSFAGAVTSLGLGEDNLLWCDTTDNYTSSSVDMERAIKECPDDKKPFMLVCVAGNCRTTNIDDIKQARKICDKYGLWLHVDACHGGTLLFSNDKEKLDGVELADSISLDPHKGLFVTYPSSYVLFKNPDVMSSYSRYPGSEESPDIMDLGLIMPFFGSRGFHSLKLWLLIKKMGYDGICKVVDNRNILNKKFSKLLKETNFFCLLNNNDFYRQAMVFYPKSVREKIQSMDNDQACDLVNKFTKVFSKELYESEKVCLDSFSLVDYSNAVGFGHYKYNAIGVAIGHPYLEEAKILFLIDEISKVARKVELSMLKEIEAPIENTHVNISSTSPASW